VVDMVVAWRVACMAAWACMQSDRTVEVEEHKDAAPRPAVLRMLLLRAVQLLQGGLLRVRRVPLLLLAGGPVLARLLLMIRVWLLVLTLVRGRGWLVVLLVLVVLVLLLLLGRRRRRRLPPLGRRHRLAAHRAVPLSLSSVLLLFLLHRGPEKMVSTVIPPLVHAIELLPRPIRDVKRWIISLQPFATHPLFAGLLALDVQLQPELLAVC
jgi:hypothetical protein